MDFYFYDEFEKNVKKDTKKRSDKHFEKPEDAKEYFLNIEKEAEVLYKQYKKEYLDFIKNKPFYINYVMKGDTFGIYEDYLSLSFKYKDFDFNFNLEN